MPNVKKQDATLYRLERSHTILAIGAGTPKRLAAVVTGSVDATVTTSLAEYAAERQRLRIMNQDSPSHTKRVKAGVE
jgi:hypothetical protein